MRKKIKGSIGAKTFISIMALLVGCCIIIYGMVMFFLPKTYKTELTEQFLIEFEELADTLEKNGIEDSSQEISNFAIRNNASVEITKYEEMILVFSVTSENEHKNISSRFFISNNTTLKLDGQTYIVTATASLEAVAQSYDILIKLIPFIAVIIILISVAGAYICSRYFSKPLIDICGVAKRMTQLDMTWKCDTSRNDEIGVLADSLNIMSDRLKAALDNLQAANEKLQIDIENERRQEQQRIDFFTSVSHELKTPITVIKGELEGMIYEVGEYKDRDTYLKHALATVNDMENIVKDILSAARMGGSDFKLDRTDIDLTRLLGRCCRKIKGITEDKQITLSVNLQQDVSYNGDERLIQQAVSNIISNAALYSPEQAKIDVILEEHRLTVRNTGVHIAEEDLGQLFLPFFRVDKSRNRNTGGSGLGLYIVKIIFDHHGIQYKMENTSDGVMFTVYF